MSSRKRRRCFKDVTGVLFPDEVERSTGSKPAGREPPSLSSASSARSWERCGDSFLEAAAMENNLQTSGRKLSDYRKFPTLVQTAAVIEDPVHIAWSSSDGEQSTDETQEQQQQKQQLPQRPTSPSGPIQSYSRALRMLHTDKEDLPAIDTDSDLDESEEDVHKDSGEQISDCDSEPSVEKQEESPLQPSDVTEPEISGHVCDGERVGVPVSPPRSGEGSKRSVSDWVRSARALLRTPQKAPSRAPQDSAKKKRKFQSGGLAERLGRLGSRQRSAVSFWRHQSISDTPTAATTTTTTTVDRPGVLVLEVLEVHEECSMQLASCCEPARPPPGEARRRRDPPAEGEGGRRRRLLVLFSRETAAQLIPAPGDVVHVYPPWQILSIEGSSCNAVLNTHFSQKVFSAAKLDPGGLPPAGRRGPPPLCGTFGLLEAGGTTAEMEPVQGASPGSRRGDGGGGGGSGASPRRSLSLLEAIEGLGQAGCVGQEVEAVVQRVYSVPVPDCSPGSTLKARPPSGSSSAPPPAEKGRTRLCVLVQDGYGTFSVVQLHLLPCSDDLHHYRREWQGRTCRLRGIKVVQRVTRERSTRLFSLIDSLWPPVMPLKDHGDTPGVRPGGRPAGVAPGFCYLLSGQESSVEPGEDGAASPLYRPPARQTLPGVLQSERQTCRCSFVATVLYKRETQGRDVGQGEVWLLLTDAALQEEEEEEEEEEERPPERPRGRTVALCVSTSCALTSSVLAALNSPAPCRVSFTDAIREHGVLLCAEQSVVEVVSEPRAEAPPGPVRLDPLTPEVTPNSVCSLSGVIVGVDEATAYSWPACNRCGSDNLEMSPETPPKLRCGPCAAPVEEPDTRIQLEVFLSSSLSNCTLKVKLQQKTIASILNSAALGAHEFPGYNVENVLGKAVGPLAVYVRVVTRKPALWIGLEEICL